MLTKRAAAAELAALLALCAVSNNDRVGLVALHRPRSSGSSPPNKGPRHVLRLLRDILAFEPQKTGTDLAAALDYLVKVQRRRAIVFVISDFLGTGYEKAFRRAARKHDLIAVRTADPRERDWPAVGLVRLRDAETGRQVLVDTGDSRVREAFASRAAARTAAFTKLARGCAGRPDRRQHRRQPLRRAARLLPQARPPPPGASLKCGMWNAECGIEIDRPCGR